MGIILMPGIAGGGHDLDVITATAGDVVAGKVIVDKDGNPLTGTLALTGDAGTGDVRRGKTFYSTNPKSKQTGTMREQAGGTFTPGVAQQTLVPANTYVTSAVIMRSEKYYYATSTASPSGSMTMLFNGDASVSDVIYYYNGTLPSGVTLILATARCDAYTEEGSIIQYNGFGVFGGKWPNTVYRMGGNQGCALYPTNINSYRYQSGTSYRLPLGGRSGTYHITLIGQYR